MKQWKPYKLDDFIEFNPTISLKKGVVATKITMDKIAPNCRQVIHDEKAPYDGGMKFQNNDTIMARVTPCLENGKCAFISDLQEGEIAFGSTEYFVLRARPGISDPMFVYYLAISPEIKNVAIQSMTGTSGRQRAQIDVLQNYIKALPEIKEQQQIATILSSLDNKIELNRRINDNLEQQAQALFKSWFVNNPNPNWREATLSEVAHFIGGYSYNGEELTDSSNVAMATIKNFGRNGGFKVDGFKDITPLGKLKECHYANMFDILVAHTDLTQNADVIGNAELLLTKGNYESIIFSMDLVKVLPNNSFPYKFLLAAMLKSKVFKGHCLGYVNGTTVLHLSKKALPEFEIKIPSESEANMMNDTLASLYKRMAEVLQENDRLTRLRDTLLPKLISGELKINDLNC